MKRKFYFFMYFGNDMSSISKAGGANTTKNGLNFELLTCVKCKLIEDGYTLIKKNVYAKQVNDGKWIFTKQIWFQKYIEKEHNVKINRQPDEAFLFYDCDNNLRKIFIIEKKAQNCAGSVIDKLLAGIGIKRIYEMKFGPEVEINYGFVVNNYLWNNMSEDMKIVIGENDIPIIEGGSENYFADLFQFIYGEKIKEDGTL